MTKTVIVAHGLWLPGDETILLRNRLKSAGFEPVLFRFPTLRGTLAENVQSLEALANEAVGDKVHFVGYSLGGVVALTMLAGSDLPRAGRVVCLGAPLRGSRTASRVARTLLGRKVIGRSLLEHNESGGIDRWESDIELGIIAGTRSVGIGRLFRSMANENDGTVMVDETRLPGASAHMTLPVTHTQMLFDQAVASQTIHFLRHGRFE
jgi:pimeloyl-ACP methyl ester carboxylesterase